MATGLAHLLSCNLDLAEPSSPRSDGGEEWLLAKVPAPPVHECTGSKVLDVLLLGRSYSVLFLFRIVQSKTVLGNKGQRFESRRAHSFDQGFSIPDVHLTYLSSDLH
jgi:hypothetical protein